MRWREALTSVTPVAIFGTLICCALPIALVALGAGATFASLVSSMPWLVTLSRQKHWMFAGAALLLLMNWWALYRSGEACRPGGVCHSSHPLGRTLRGVFWGSTGLYALGFVAAYMLPLLVL
ncbi:MAG: hypothetical protein ACRELD_12005 [Longimicrobiales bacterium]